MWGRIVIAFVVAVVASGLPATGRAEEFADPAFQALWASTDAPVASGQADYSWVWGPAPISPGRQEPYAEAPNGQRLVQYFDKGRMELAGPGQPVTSGLLARELLTGLVQTGDRRQEQRTPAAIPVAGDADSPDSPTYATLGRVVNRPPAAEGAAITEVIDRPGSIGADGVLARYNVTASLLIPETRHRLASVFRGYFSGVPLPNTEGEPPETAPFDPWYATVGLPITEPYWARVRVGGVDRDVLVQAFERRVLTYTPANPVGSRVEMGNVGRHYLDWRAGETPPAVASLPCPAVPDPPAAGRDEGRLAVLGSALHDVGGRRTITGLIRNDGDSRPPIEVVAVRLTADGRSLGRSSGFTDRDFWPNGQVAGFEIDVPSDEPIASWRIEPRITGNKASGGLAGGFAIEDLGGSVDGLGTGRVQGQLRYTGSEPFSDLALIRIYALDACGGLVTNGLARAGSGAIQPGAVLPFSALLPRAEGATRLKAVVEARVGTVSSVADDALRVYEGGLFPAPIVPITTITGCCTYIRAYERPDGTPVRSIYRRAGGA